MKAGRIGTRSGCETAHRGAADVRRRGWRGAGYERAAGTAFSRPRARRNDTIAGIGDSQSRSVARLAQVLTGEGATAVGNTPADFDAVIRADISKWAKIIKENGIRAQ